MERATEAFIGEDVKANFIRIVLDVSRLLGDYRAVPR